jgi:Ca2+-binding EF-hand superfamily protein
MSTQLEHTTETNMAQSNLSNLLFATAGVCVFAPATGAAAQPAGSPGDRATQQTLRILDLDQDGSVAAAEIADEQARLFAAIDVNADGAISVDEFRRNGRLLLALNVTTFFDMMDVDGDGQLSSSEVSSPAQRWLSRYDADGSGSLSEEEIRAARLGIGN